MDTFIDFILITHVQSKGKGKNKNKLEISSFSGTGNEYLEYLQNHRDIVDSVLPAYQSRSLIDYKEDDDKEKQNSSHEEVLMLTPITDYGCFLNELAQSLILDNNQMDFFRYNLGLHCPLLMAQGARYIYYLIGLVLGTKKVQELESLKHDAKKQFDEFRKKITDSDRELDL